MLVKECRMPDISDLQPKIVSNFLVNSLAGFINRKPKEVQAALSVIARLIDKAAYEYAIAREAIIEEEQEGKLTYEEIMQRNEGQYLYTCSIINHLENCINTLARIYKIVALLPVEFKSPAQKGVISVRNAVEHIDERITRAVQGSLSLNISEDALVVEITGEQLRLDDIANEIRSLHKTMLDFMNG